jgi:hypothetical protein
VRLLLDTDGLVYRKWGGEQRAKAGDWIVDNDGDVYTVDAEVFARTYRPVSEWGPGAYVKVTSVWAERATQPGTVTTKEGVTAYEPGDFLVSNNRDGSDAYAVGAKKFEEMYTAAVDPGDD